VSQAEDRERAVERYFYWYAPQYMKWVKANPSKVNAWLGK
jgi:hypothetical protein